MNKKININDPAAWRELDWDDTQASDLLKRTDHQVAVARANRLKAQDPEWRKKQKAAVQLRNQSKKYQEKIQSVYNDADWQKRRLKAIKDNAADESYQQRRQEGTERFNNDPIRKAKWKQNLEAKRDIISAKKKKRMQTPDGVFNGMVDVAAFYGITKSSVQSRMNTRPDRYYYIDEQGNRMEPRKNKKK